MHLLANKVTHGTLSGLLSFRTSDTNDTTSRIGKTEEFAGATKYIADNIKEFLYSLADKRRPSHFNHPV
jgi:hypothetical protein